VPIRTVVRITDQGRYQENRTIELACGVKLPADTAAMHRTIYRGAVINRMAVQGRRLPAA
jgi:hypothetical protein